MVYTFIGFGIGFFLSSAFLYRHDIVRSINNVIINPIKKFIKSRKEKRQQYLESKNTVLNKSTKRGKIYFMQYNGLNSKDILNFIYYFKKCKYVIVNGVSDLVITYPKDDRGNQFVYMDLNRNDYIIWCDNKINRVREHEFINFCKERGI